MKLNKNMILQRAFDLDVTIQGEKILLRCAGKTKLVSDQALAILDVFATPHSVEQGIKKLTENVKGARDWMHMSNQVLNMIHAGILCSPDERVILFPSHSGKFDSPNIHIRMLNDHARTSAYRQALDRMILPSDVVVDIGTGTGILAALAALAGAKRVYAIERTANMARMAQDFFHANGLEDRITMLEGDSTRIELPEKADVLVSEIIGNDPLAEGMIQTTADARKRLLKPDAKIIPSLIRLLCLPLTLPDELYQNSVFTESQVEKWAQWYKLNFSSFADDSVKRSFSTLANTYQARKWPRLAAPIELAEIDLSANSSVVIDTTKKISIESSGTFNALILCFEVKLSEGVNLSTDPELATPSNHWANWVWLPGKCLQVRAGQKLEIRYRFDERRHSEFEVHLRE